MKMYSFVLYCHILDEDTERLLAIKSQIKNLLETKGKEGLLILFIDTGLQELLSMIHPIQRELGRFEAKQAKKELKKDFRKRSKNLRKGANRALSLEKKLESNVRVLTALDLVDIFGEMYDVENLKGFILGVHSEIRYDTPKFIEAIVRLRMIGSRVPVLRLDRDVIIPPEKEQCDLESIRERALDLCKEVETHHDTTQVLATILSANYQAPALNEKNIKVWHRGYATRIFPSLVIPEDQDANKYIKLKNKKNEKYWLSQMEKHFNHDLTNDFINRLWEWGADPRTAVISGALLYMSDAVVLNVPPFSNFSQPVVWIDDHLRYVLHREMGDFCRQTKHALKFPSQPLHVFYEDIKVPKHRPAENFMLYTAKTYLPSLLWGSFVDYWLCENNDLKLREDMVKGTHRDDWLHERKYGKPGVLAKAVREARAGYRPDEGKLRQDLIEKAQKRLEEVITIWGQLFDEKNGQYTFVSAWVNDKYPQTLKDVLKKSAEKSEHIIPSKLPDRIDKFEGSLETQFNLLLDDACRYVKWVFEWPHVMSVIRSVPPGEFRSDLDWEP
jgi:hypothetical protein